MRPTLAKVRSSKKKKEKGEGRGKGRREGEGEKEKRLFTPCGAGPGHQGGGDPGLGRPASRRGRCRWAAPRTGTVHGTIRREERPRCQASICYLGLREAPVPWGSQPTPPPPPQHLPSRGTPRMLAAMRGWVEPLTVRPQRSSWGAELTGDHLKVVISFLR